MTHSPGAEWLWWRTSSVAPGTGISRACEAACKGPARCPHRLDLARSDARHRSARTCAAASSERTSVLPREAPVTELIGARGRDRLAVQEAKLRARLA